MTKRTVRIRIDKDDIVIPLNKYEPRKYISTLTKYLNKEIRWSFKEHPELEIKARLTRVALNITTDYFHMIEQYFKDVHKRKIKMVSENK